MCIVFAVYEYYICTVHFTFCGFMASRQDYFTLFSYGKQVDGTEEEVLHREPPHKQSEWGSNLLRHSSGFGWLYWGLTSQSTIFQSYRDGAIASWVINQYFRGVKCLAQGHNTAAVGLEPRTSRSGVRHSTTEPPRSPYSSGIPTKQKSVTNSLDMAAAYITFECSFISLDICIIST